MTTRYAQIVMGPAGSGKSTYIGRMQKHYETIKRRVHCINLDPAADELQYEPTIDIREAITVSEVMEKFGYGPNGALIYCMESICNEMEWFDEAIGEHEYDYLLFDFPGQIELYSHLNVLPRIIQNLRVKGYYIVAMFLIDSQFMIDRAKFLSGSLVALSSMIMIDVPHLNILTKCDLLDEEQKSTLDNFLEMETLSICESVKSGTKLRSLTEKICEVIDQFNLIQYFPLNIKDEDSVMALQVQTDILMQYYDNADFDDPEFNINAQDNVGSADTGN